MGKVLIAYATKTGTTADAAALLAKRLTKPFSLYDLSKKPRAAELDLRAYDIIVLGTGMYCGRPRRELAAFCRENEALLRGKKLFLFTCGIGSEQEEIGYLRKELPAGVMEHIVLYRHVGGEIRLDRLGALARFGLGQYLKHCEVKPALSGEAIGVLGAAIDKEGE